MIKIKCRFVENVEFSDSKLQSHCSHLHLEHVSCGFSIYHLTFGDKDVRVFGFHIRNQFLETLKAELSFQICERSLSDCFGRK